MAVASGMVAGLGAGVHLDCPVALLRLSFLFSIREGVDLAREYHRPYIVLVCLQLSSKFY